jgi:hypothetical protein
MLPSTSKPNKRTEQEKEYVNETSKRNKGLLKYQTDMKTIRHTPLLRSFRQINQRKKINLWIMPALSNTRQVSHCYIFQANVEQLDNVSTIFQNVALHANDRWRPAKAKNLFDCVPPWAQHHAIALDPGEMTACGCRQGEFSMNCPEPCNNISSRYYRHVKQDSSIQSSVFPLCATADCCLLSFVF